MTVYLNTKIMTLRALKLMLVVNTLRTLRILQRIILNQPELALAISLRCFSIGEIGVTILQVLLLPLEHALVSIHSILSNANMSGNHFVPGNDNSPFPYFLYSMAV